MAAYYFDSSALVKLYILETGSQWVKRLWDEKTPGDQPAHAILTSSLSAVEVPAAMAKRQRMREISDHLQALLFARFVQDSRSRYVMLRVDDAIIDSAANLTQEQPLRAYDAVQLATALQLDKNLRGQKQPGCVFVSADDTLCDAARAQGLLAENPNET